jgi:thymidylate kinase
VKGLPAPDVTLFMSLAPEAAAARGDYGQERYEDAAFQEKVRPRAPARDWREGRACGRGMRGAVIALPLLL